MLKTLAILLMISSTSVYPQVDLYSDLKYCGFVPRNTDGSIKRKQSIAKEFQKHNPCPSTGSRSGACPGRSVDHVRSLACAGCDRITNMQWLPNKAKSCSNNYCKDRFERHIWSVTGKEPGLNLDSCKARVLTPDFFEEKTTTKEDDKVVSGIFNVGIRGAF